MSWILVAVTAVSATASIVGGIAKNDADKAAATQYEQNAKVAKIGADQEEVLRREDLISTLSAIDAVRTSRGLDPTSPTGMALSERKTELAQRGIDAAKVNGLNTAQGYQTQASIANTQGSAALVGGFLNAGTTVLDSGLLDKKKSGS